MLLDLADSAQAADRRVDYPPIRARRPHGHGSRQSLALLLDRPGAPRRIAKSAPRRAIASPLRRPGSPMRPTGALTTGWEIRGERPR